MSVGRFSDYQVQQWLTDASQDGYWLALHYDNPDIAGAYASEVFGGTYKRVRADFTSVDGRTIWNAGPVRWPGLPSIVITHVAGWDAQLNGNLLWYSSLDAVVRITQGSAWAVSANTIALSMN